MAGARVWARCVLLVALAAAGFGGRAFAGTSQDLLAAGWRAYQAGDMVAAQTAFARAAAVSPGSATPAVWLGAVLVVRGDRAAARRWFQAALLRRPTIAEAGYAETWLARLGVETLRPRWRVDTLRGLGQFVRASNTRLSSGQALWVAQAIRTAARHEGIDERILAAVLYIESRFEHQSISSAGAEGLGQLMPGTAAGLGVNPRDPWQNVLGAALLLRADYAEFHGWPLTLAAYNAGSGAVRRWGGIPPFAETQWYVWAVLWVYGSLET